MITKDAIEQRIATLLAEREQLVANVLAHDGAIQDCRWFLEQLEAGEANSPATPIEGDTHDDDDSGPS
jgi:hypothetical protein